MSRAVAVVFGGASAEAEVSRVSASAVARALAARGYRVTLLQIAPAIMAELSACGAEVVFPTAHGPLGEDGCLQGLLEIGGIPYVGSGVMASALGANKRAAKVQFEHAGLPVAKGRVVTAGELDAALPAVLRSDLGAALVTKPMSGGSGIGVTRISSSDPDSKLAQALADAFEVDPRVLVEAFKLGDEVTCGVLEDERGVAKALPPTRIIAKSADWYDFTSRYGTGGSEHECPARYPAELNQRIQDLALRAHLSLEARDLSRVDFVVSRETGEVTVLELNTLPGMTATSLFPEAAGIAGVGFEDLCAQLVERALRRPPRNAPKARAMPA